MAKEDADLDLKLRMQRIFWRMGFYCSLEIMVSIWEYETQKRHDITDIDVFGVHFAEDLRMTRIIADCKSGEETAGRLLWLRGAMDLLGTSTGYFVKKRLHSNTRAIAAKLNISTLDIDNLALLEKQVDTSQVPGLVGDRSIYEIRTDLWGIRLPKGTKPNGVQAQLKKIYQYFDYNYWFIERQRNIFTCIEYLTSIKDILSVGDKRSEILLYRIAALFTISLLEAGRYIISISLSEVSSFARQYIFGGTLALREREKFFELLKRYTGEEVKLEPTYFPLLLELINTIVRNSSQSASCPRYIEAIELFKAQGTSLNLKEFFGKEFNEGTLKITKDIVLFLVDICNLNKSLITDLLAQ